MFVFHPFNGNGGSQLVTKDFLEISRELLGDKSVNCLVGFGKYGFLGQEKILFNIDNKYLRIFFLPFISIYLNFYFLGKRNVIGVTIFSIYSLFLKTVFYPQSTIIYLHEVPNSKVFLRLLSFFEKRRAQLLFVSNFHKNEIGLNGKVIYNYVDRIDQEFLPKPNKRLIFVGSGNLKKGFDVFLQICKYLPSDEYEFDAYLNSCTKELEFKARSQGVNLKFNTTNKYEFFKDGGVLIQTSRAKETFSLVSLEAASWGIPVVTFNQEVISEILLQENILDFNPRNFEEIPNVGLAIARLLEDDQRYMSYSVKLKERSKNFNKSRFEENIKHIIDKSMFDRD